jgi:hypothetical protein
MRYDLLRAGSRCALLSIAPFPVYSGDQSALSGADTHSRSQHHSHRSGVCAIQPPGKELARVAVISMLSCCERPIVASRLRPQRRHQRDLICRGRCRPCVFTNETVLVDSTATCPQRSLQAVRGVDGPYIYRQVEELRPNRARQVRIVVSSPPVPKVDCYSRLARERTDLQLWVFTLRDSESGFTARVR